LPTPSSKWLVLEASLAPPVTCRRAGLRCSGDGTVNEFGSLFGEG
jgi:hypothetical protein